MSTPFNEARHNAKREAILSAAVAVWTEQGLVDLGHVAAQAGLAKSNIYNYWSDRDELLRAVRDRLVERLQDTSVTQSDRACASALIIEIALELTPTQVRELFSSPDVAQQAEQVARYLAGAA